MTLSGLGGSGGADVGRWGLLMIGGGGGIGAFMGGGVSSSLSLLLESSSMSWTWTQHQTVLQVINTAGLETVSDHPRKSEVGWNTIVHGVIN